MDSQWIYEKKFKYSWRITHTGFGFSQSSFYFESFGEEARISNAFASLFELSADKTKDREMQLNWERPESNETNG